VSISLSIGVVVIGRNEGERLRRCLESLRAQSMHQLVYVDSGSLDDSVEMATRVGALTLALDMREPFTAARARNAGLSLLLETWPNLQFVQFVDGDCEVAMDWLVRAHAFLGTNEHYAVVCGRRRERFPAGSIYNQMCDLEWATPVGDADACGGDALFRLNCLTAVQGFNPDLIAGEEPELCLRLRRKGWKVYRLDAEMTLHDAAIYTFAQWWQRAKRGGHAYAQVSEIARHARDSLWTKELIRAGVWAVLLPLLTGVAWLIWWPIGALSLACWALQLRRLRMRSPLPGLNAWKHASLLLVAKFAEFSGAVQFYFRRLVGAKPALIEYK
jgi:GT2 family glycosyltransferase